MLAIIIQNWTHLCQKGQDKKALRAVNIFLVYLILSQITYE